MPEFRRALQENLITLLCYDDDRAKLIRNTVDVNLFEGIFREFARRIYAYLDKFSKPPKDHIADELEDILEGNDKRRADSFRNMLLEIHESKDRINADYVVSRMQTFVRRQTFKQAAIEAVEAIQSGTGDDDESIEQAEDIILAALKKRANVFDPGIDLSNPDQALKFLDQLTDPCPTGIPEFDMRGLGPIRKGLHLFIGLPKAGKCVAAGTYILMPDRSTKLIESVVRDKDKAVMAHDFSTGRLVEAKVARHFDSGLKRCLHIETKSGKHIVVSENHPLLSSTGWEKANNFCIGQSIAVTRSARVDEIAWDWVKMIFPCGEHQTYDIEVKNHHNFIGGGIVVHNSRWLRHLGKKAALDRRNVIYITLENSAEMTAQTFLQSFFMVPKRIAEDLFQYLQFEFDRDGKLVGFIERELAPQMSLADEAIRARLTAKIKASRNILERIRIKEFPTGSLSIRELEAYLDSLEASSGFQADLLLVDYIDLMKIDAKNKRIDLGQMTINLRGLAVKRNLALASVSQSSRKGLDAGLVTEGHVAEDFSKIATADTVFTFSRTAEEKALGLARIYVSNARQDEDKITAVISQNYPTEQFILESMMLSKDYRTSLDQFLGVDGDGQEDDE